MINVQELVMIMEEHGRYFMDKLLLIDADSLCFICSKESIDGSIALLDGRIDHIFNQVDATQYMMFISSGKYFRHDIDPQYKSARAKASQPLLWLKTLKSYLVERYHAVAMPKVEADDLVAYYYNKAKKMNFEPVIAAIDKDIIKSIPGKHFNYTFKDNPNDFKEGWWVETSKEEAELFKAMQILMGDASDGVKGLVGVGEKTAEKILSGSKNHLAVVFQAYLNFYNNPAKATFEFQKNYRLLHMLDCDDDFIREVGVVPQVELHKIFKREENGFDF